MAAMLLVSFALMAQPSAQEQEEQAFAQRIYEAQMSDNDSAFYDVHQAFMDYLEQREDWEKYYRSWMNRVIYDVNHKHFHRAFTQIHYITEDIRERHQEKYLYIPNMCLGLYYNSRNQPEMGEEHFRRALRGIDTEREPVAVFNCYLSLAQSLSFKRPSEAMACLDSLPQQMLQNPMYESGVLRVGTLLGTEENRTLAREFRTEVSDDVKVCVSPLLQELLNCLLDNADKYASGGTVLMSCHPDAEGTYAISVSNQGPAIPAADAERIFEPFVRLSPDEHSLGIGLPLARRLAVSMGYTIVLDQEYTEGARFVVKGI